MNLVQLSGSDIILSSSAASQGLCGVETVVLLVVVIVLVPVVVSALVLETVLVLGVNVLLIVEVDVGVIVTGDVVLIPVVVCKVEMSVITGGLELLVGLEVVPSPTKSHRKQ